jgi:hypothetical protein
MTDKNVTGSYQVVVQGETDAISVRLLDPSTGSDRTLTSGTVTIYGVGGDEKVASTPATTSGAVASYSHAFTEANGFQRDLGYRAVWALVVGAVTYRRETYFQVARRRFVSQLTDADMTSAHPYLSAQLSGGMASHRTKAWAEIERRVFGKVRRYPGNVFHPERFFEAHEWLTLANAFFALSFDANPTSEDWAKYNEARKRGLEALDSAMSILDFDSDDDGILDTRELRQNFRMVNVRR